METCSHEGCNRKVQAAGLCGTHYQRMRRQGIAPGGGRRGPKPKYPAGIGDPFGGAPRIGTRLDPEVNEWVHAQGGAKWLRRMLRELRLLSMEKGFARYWERLKPQQPDEEAP